MNVMINVARVLSAEVGTPIICRSFVLIVHIWYY